MLDSLRLYGRYAAVSLRGQMQYRVSFIMLSLSTFAVTGAEFAPAACACGECDGPAGRTQRKGTAHNGKMDHGFTARNSTAKRCGKLRRLSVETLIKGSASFIRGISDRV